MFKIYEGSKIDVVSIKFEKPNSLYTTDFAKLTKSRFRGCQMALIDSSSMEFVILSIARK